MKMYRDMTAEERAVVDQDHASYLETLKQDAEWYMEWFDSLDPDVRELERNEELF